ncbi:dephospho-CoA kinase [Coralliovum pocilloporae]|uniref:dephospho-CoA kinase n=1 Tax=Coralliovum pocilloporae TaxID=3066369 RepID=UPI0033070424
MILIGLTGSIGMGKSTTAGLFSEFGVVVHDADAAVHALYASKAVPLIAERFPDAVSDGRVDRQKLGALVLGDKSAMKELEAIVHPLVHQAEFDVLMSAEESGAWAALLDIPLLFETGGDKRVDVTLVVSAPTQIQKDRVLARPGMTEEKFAQILARQMPDDEKRSRADFVVETGSGIDDARAQVQAIVEQLKTRPQEAWENRKSGKGV